MDRRLFIKRTALGTTALGLVPGLALAGPAAGRLVILHTNDTHSRIEPFPAGSGRFAGMGGVARRAGLVEKIRRDEPHTLLLDSGDIFQGTPYFNLFDGEVEFKAMSQMRYDAATLGNHDFDNGVEGLVAQLPHAAFPFVSSNYDVSGSALDGRVQPYLIKQVGPVKVGLFGLGIAFERLVLKELHRGVTYQDPLPIAREMVQHLRGQGCQLVVCLSHLGYEYRDGDVDDVTVATQTPGLDLILGGHTHTFLDTPHVVEHANERPTFIHQVGWAGIWLGRIDVPFGPRGAIGTPRTAAYAVDQRWEQVG